MFLPPLNPQLGLRRQLKTIVFRIPTRESPQKPAPPMHDPASTWNTLKDILPGTDNTVATRVSENEKRVLNVFGAPHFALLPRPEPHRSPSPYEYFCTVNESASHVEQPRLSVTKLLTDAWCELQTFYDVFAGLPSARSARLSSGTRHHENLEKQAHPRVDARRVEKQIESAAQKHAPEAVEVLFGTPMAAQLASQWSEHVTMRLVEMADTCELREIHVHGFLDLARGSLVTDAARVRAAVLVNGVVDLVRVDASNHTQREPWLEEGVRDAGGARLSTRKLLLVDLSCAIPRAKATMTALSKDHFVHVYDVKTRQNDTIPAQRSVLDAARRQCMFYSRFLADLARDSNYAYQSWLENGRRRRVEPDAPLGTGNATELLLRHFETLALDYLRLARGTDLGFDDFDNSHTHRQKQNVDGPEHAPRYTLSDFVSAAQFREMLAALYGQDSPFLELDVTPLFSAWNRPLTLRYFAARAGQTCNILEAVVPGSVGVEYHNMHTRRLLKRMHFALDGATLTAAVQHAASFWNGTRLPTATDDMKRCVYCLYKNRCPVKNRATEKVGERIYRLCESQDGECENLHGA